MIVIVKYVLRYESTKIISCLTRWSVNLCRVSSHLADMLERLLLRIKTFDIYFILRAFV